MGGFWFCSKVRAQSQNQDFILFLMGSRFSCVVTGMERLSLDLLQAVKNIVGCRGVWNL